MQQPIEQSVVQAVARRLVPLRWPRSQKLIGYYDLDSEQLIYQDQAGRVLESVDLAQYRVLEQTKS
jgi:hypothetical protein